MDLKIFPLLVEKQSREGISATQLAEFTGAENDLIGGFMFMCHEPGGLLLISSSSVNARHGVSGSLHHPGPGSVPSQRQNGSLDSTHWQGWSAVHVCWILSDV